MRATSVDWVSFLWEIRPRVVDESEARAFAEEKSMVSLNDWSIFIRSAQYRIELEAWAAVSSFLTLFWHSSWQESGEMKRRRLIFLACRKWVCWMRGKAILSIEILIQVYVETSALQNRGIEDMMRSMTNLLVNRYELKHLPSQSAEDTVDVNSHKSRQSCYCK